MKHLIVALALLPLGCTVAQHPGQPPKPKVDYTGKVVKSIRDYSMQTIYIEFEDGSVLKIGSHKGLYTRDLTEVEK